MTVETGGKRSAPVVMSVVDTNPGIFTADASGTGQAAALRVSGTETTITTAANPVRSGEVLVLYASGVGAVTPTATDGSIIGLPLPRQNAAVKVSVGGKSASVLYAGPAPGLVAGVTQINVKVPDSLPKGPAAVLLVANENVSLTGVTVEVQ